MSCRVPRGSAPPLNAPSTGTGVVVCIIGQLAGTGPRPELFTDGWSSVIESPHEPGSGATRTGAGRWSAGPEESRRHSPGSAGACHPTLREEARWRARAADASERSLLPSTCEERAPRSKERRRRMRDRRNPQRHRQTYEDRHVQRQRGEWWRPAQKNAALAQRKRSPARHRMPSGTERPRRRKFPLADIRKAGYGAIWHGQKAWNGVAILARGTDPVETRRGLPGDPEDLHSRYIEAAVGGLTMAAFTCRTAIPHRDRDSITSSLGSSGFRSMARRSSPRMRPSSWQAIAT